MTPALTVNHRLVIHNLCMTVWIVHVAYPSSQPPVHAGSPQATRGRDRDLLNGADPLSAVPAPNVVAAAHLPATIATRIATPGRSIERTRAPTGGPNRNLHAALEGANGWATGLRQTGVVAGGTLGSSHGDDAQHARALTRAAATV
ncbi:MAG: hypothetical protein QOK20_1365, partial [Acidimicrobiaceae bacterium]|nr:hypothetical protein [Acidimicrobiaceae bacterium]